MHVIRLTHIRHGQLAYSNWSEFIEFCELRCQSGGCILGCSLKSRLVGIFDNFNDLILNKTHIYYTDHQYQMV